MLTLSQGYIISTVHLASPNQSLCTCVLHLYCGFTPYTAAVSKLEIWFKPLSDSSCLTKAQRRCVDSYTFVYAGRTERASPAISNCGSTQDSSGTYITRKRYGRFLGNRHATLRGSNVVRSTFRITSKVRLERHDFPDPFAEWRRKHRLHSLAHLNLSFQQLSQCLLQHAAYEVSAERSSA